MGVQSFLDNQEEISVQTPFWRGLTGIIILYFSILLSRVINFKNFLQFVLAYLITSILLYGIFLGVNVNNPTIDAWDFFGNGFFELKVLTIIDLIFLIAYVVRLNSWLNALVQKYT
ncbi:TPA: hypothetical protein ACGOZO_001639, partial [Streptococcus suis]